MHKGGAARTGARSRPGLALATLVGVALAYAVPGAEPERLGFCFNAWPPYAYVQDGVATGLSVRVLDEAARRSGVVIDYLERPWKRCLHEVRTGTIDAAIDAASRPEFVQGPVSYSVYTNTFWVRDDAELQSFSLEGLRGKTIGLVTGYRYPAELVEDAPYRIDYSVDDDTNLRKLAAGRVDAIVADLVSTVRAAESAKLGVRPLLPSHSVDRLYPSFNEKRGAVQKRFDAALAEMQAEGYFAAVYREMLGVDFDELLATSE